MAAKKRSYHTLRDFLFVLFKQQRVILGVFIAALVAAVAVCAVLDPVYEASSKLLVVAPGAERAADDSARTELIAVAADMLTGRFLIEKVVQDIGAKRLYPDAGGRPAPDAYAVLRVRENLSIRTGPIIHVLFEHRDPALAAEVVNRLVEHFRDHYLAARRRHHKYEFFKEQFDLMEKKLRESQNQLGLFRNENNISSIQKQKSLLLLQISDMEVELGKTRADIIQQEDLAAAKKNPDERAELQQKLAALRGREKKLSQQITQYRLDLGLLDKAETRLSDLERQVKIDEENYLLYAKKTEEARIASAMDDQKLASFSVIEPALPPIVPVGPHRGLIVLAALLIGCSAGIVLALLREYITHTFDTAEDAADILGCPAPAALPELTPAECSAAAGLNFPEKTIEQCVRLSHHLRRMLPDRPCRSVVFTGAAEHVGVSWALIAFGCALAEQGSRVLLIDANLRQPVLHRLCAVTDAAGLSDAISSGTALHEVIRTTVRDRLTVIPAGASTENPALLLQQDRCRELFAQARRHADWVLVDAPPVNPHNDAGMLAAAVDGAVLVVRANATRWEVARSAAARLQQYNLALLGSLLTRHRKYIPEWIYRRL